MHGSLPVRANLLRRGIRCTPLCPWCWRTWKQRLTYSGTAYGLRKHGAPLPWVIKFQPLLPPLLVYG
ncbi:hypothetical protein SESBI_45736 [Sesbania bispinosa]|nr:hypothetical protein SESBI_45736 [Sesbania bispinosa]